ncbi:impact [Fusarium circinatum]|uniref:Impact n=1 Tax=Fusarium circinatum TaxID=48490 RepID=A0A8H5TK02_FUSCI|nr:impact [Fusarium circinatum]
MSMMAAMGQVKALQSKNLRSIAQIADAPLATVEEALSGDAKAAKSLHTACKNHEKKSGTKRGADGGAAPAEAKKPKLETHRRDLDYGSMSGDDLEASLELPLQEDEDIIRNTTILTNRAPLFLAFAVELLRYTMPEQPLSSRLSLAQAVVSANSRTKAISIGIEKAPPGGEEKAPEGQPKITIMNRPIPVLKRSGYTWSGSSQPASSSASSITLQGIFKSLMAEKPELETATHNAWAIRTSFGNSPLKQEASFDDGESGCGSFLLQQLRDLDISNMLVVLTRWYGGIMLGPDRWRLMKECLNDALSSQKRTSSLNGEPVWALNLEDKSPSTSTVGMPIHRPEGARNYILRAFAPADDSGKKTVTAANEEKQENLGRVLGALRLLFASWAGILSRDELDKRAWTWYMNLRPDVDAGPAGWGAKGTLNLGRILDLRRKETS